MFSPDGKLLYFFGDDVLIYDTDAISSRSTRGSCRGRSRRGSGASTSDRATRPTRSPASTAASSSIQDPVQNRRIMGVGRVDLPRRASSVASDPLGPRARPVGFSLAPDRKRAYGLLQEIGHYEFWTFDLENTQARRQDRVRRTAAHGAADEHERQAALHLSGRRHDRPLRREHLQVPAHDDARRAT